MTSNPSGGDPPRRGSTCSWGEAIRVHAQRRGDEVALVSVSGETTWEELDLISTRLAHLYRSRDVEPGALVAIALPNDLACVVAVIACWKVGAVPLVLPPGLTEREARAILDVAKPDLLVGGAGPVPALLRERGLDGIPRPLEASRDCPESALPEVESPCCRATCSGGSTGMPKVIVDHTPARCDPDAGMYTVPAGSVTLVPGPLHHSGPFLNAFWTLLGGGRLVLMERFDAARTLQLIDAWAPDYLALVPTMMLRIWRLPEAVRQSCDLSSLKRVVSSGAPCPQWLMRAWIDWLGAGRMFEAYGASERVGGTLISGHEWLQRPGSVGRPTLGRLIRILDRDGQVLPAGEIGQVYLKTGDGDPGFHYLGAEAEIDPDGWITLGDLGYLDEDGYLYLTDRKSDMIVSGGSNIYPAEVEAAIEAHPDVLCCVVIGLPDEDLGERVHAIVQSERLQHPESVERFLRDRLSPYKRPRSIEIVREPLRNDAGKVRRSALRAARKSAKPEDSPGA